jgi:hypothetical protein
MQLLILQFPPLTCYLIPIRHHQHPLLEHFSLCCFLNLKTKFRTHGHIQYINKQRDILFASVLDIFVMFITPEYRQEKVCFFPSSKKGGTNMEST